MILAPLFIFGLFNDALLNWKTIKQRKSKYIF
jgi:hypothetical protein